MVDTRELTGICDLFVGAQLGGGGSKLTGHSIGVFGGYAAWAAGLLEQKKKTCLICVQK